MLGTATGFDSWTNHMRSLSEDPKYVPAATQLFFISYVILVVIVAVNIIVAVLLESFMASLVEVVNPTP